MKKKLIISTLIVSLLLFGSVAIVVLRFLLASGHEAKRARESVVALEEEIAEAQEEIRLRHEEIVAGVPPELEVDPARDCFAAMERFNSALYDTLELLTEALFDGWGEIDGEVLADIRERIAPLRDADRLTELEAALDPGIYGEEELRKNLYDFLRQSEVLRRFETAIGFGVCSPAVVNYDVLAFYKGRRLLAAEGMLACEFGDFETAFRTLSSLLSISKNTRHNSFHEYTKFVGYIRASRIMSCYLSSDAVTSDMKEKALKLIPGDTPLNELRKAMRVGLRGPISSAFGVKEKVMIQTMNLFPGKRLFPDKKDWANLIEYASQIEALAELPPFETAETRRSLEDEYEFPRLMFLVEGVPEKVYGLYWRNKKHAQLPGFAMVVEHYRQENDGIYPESIEGLLAFDDVVVPIDPSTGDSIEYVRTRDGFDLYGAHRKTSKGSELGDSRGLLWRVRR